MLVMLVGDQQGENHRGGAGVCVGSTLKTHKEIKPLLINFPLFSTECAQRSLHWHLKDEFHPDAVTTRLYITMCQCG